MFLRRLTGDDAPSHNGTEVDTSTLSFTVDHTEPTRVGFEGQTYTCTVNRSPDGNWATAFGHGEDHCRVFGLRDGNIEYSVPAERPVESWIANDGSAVVVDGQSMHDTGTVVSFVSPADDRPLRLERSSNVASAAISSDGSIGAFVSIGDEGAVYIYDLGRNEERVRYEPPNGTRHAVAFDESSNHCYVYDETAAVLVCGIDTDGEEIWLNSRFRNRVPFFTRQMNRLRSRLRD